MKLDTYVGRTIRLNQRAFAEMAGHDRNKKAVTENCFLVAKVNHPLRKLICYGAHHQISVRAADVVLV